LIGHAIQLLHKPSIAKGTRIEVTSLSAAVFVGGTKKVAMTKILAPLQHGAVLNNESKRGSFAMNDHDKTKHEHFYYCFVRRHYERERERFGSLNASR